MVYGAIYLVTNQVNGKRYVGQTTMTLDARWSAHVSAAMTGAADTMLYRAIRKHGRGAFVVSLLAECATRQELDASERHWIATLGVMVPGGYNLTDGGMAGGKHSPETCAKKSASQKRRYADPAVRHEQARRLRGSTSDPAAQAKKAASLAARWTPERRAEWASKVAVSVAAATAARSRYAAERKPVRCRINLASKERSPVRGLRVLATAVASGEAQRFKSARAAGIALGIATSSVHYALKRGEPLHGFTFQHKE